MDESCLKCVRQNALSDAVEDAKFNIVRDVLDAAAQYFDFMAQDSYVEGDRRFALSLARATPAPGSILSGQSRTSDIIERADAYLAFLEGTAA